MIRGEAEPPPVAELVGFRMTDAGEGFVVMEMRDRRAPHEPARLGARRRPLRHRRRRDGLRLRHAARPAEATWTTVELKINYLRPAWPGDAIRAEGRVVNAGRTLALTECDVTNAAGKLVARASSTVMRLEPGTLKSAE